MTVIIVILIVKCSIFLRIFVKVIVLRDAVVVTYCIGVKMIKFEFRTVRVTFVVGMLSVVFIIVIRRVKRVLIFRSFCLVVMVKSSASCSVLIGFVVMIFVEVVVEFVVKISIVILMVSVLMKLWMCVMLEKWVVRRWVFCGFVVTV